jgi:hypothetical protein
MSPASQGWNTSIKSSSSASETDTQSPPGTYPLSNRSKDDFAERFKYLICSSGILEKDYVPGLSGGLSEVGLDGIADAEGGKSSTSPTEHVGSQELEGDSGSGPVVDLRYLMQEGKRKWDIVLAGVVLLCGMLLGAGVRWFLLYSGSAGTFLAGLVWHRYRKSPVSLIPWFPRFQAKNT